MKVRITIQFDNELISHIFTVDDEEETQKLVRRLINMHLEYFGKNSKVEHVYVDYFEEN